MFGLSISVISVPLLHYGWPIVIIAIPLVLLARKIHNKNKKLRQIQYALEGFEK
jgi:branched-subunit amino acid permease